MSMPKFPKPDPDLTQEQALTMILSSIALEEAALSRIIKAEGDKIQYILGNTHCGKPSACIQDVLAVNKSAAKLLEIVMQNQILLKNKMDSVLEHLPFPQRPPCAPAKPCRRACYCPAPCKPKDFCSFESFSSYEILPKVYCYNEPLQWAAKNYCASDSQKICGCDKIELPEGGPFVIDFYAKFKHLGRAYGWLELIISCKNSPEISKKIQISCFNQGEAHEKICITPPRSCFTCSLSIVVKTSDGICIHQGGITLTKP